MVFCYLVEGELQTMKTKKFSVYVLLLLLPAGITFMAVKAEVPQEMETIVFSAESVLKLKQKTSSLDFRGCKGRY